MAWAGDVGTSEASDPFNVQRWAVTMNTRMLLIVTALFEHAADSPGRIFAGDEIIRKSSGESTVR